LDEPLGKLKAIEFDVSAVTFPLTYRSQAFIPSLSLAFEYQGESHYFSTITYGSSLKRQQMDEIKKDITSKIGITLISIPFWWNKSLSSLAATIRHYRPDVPLNVLTDSLPIQSHLPERLKQRFYYKPNVPQEYSENIDPTGWYVYSIFIY
jgi:hypothetical protein